MQAITDKTLRIPKKKGETKLTGDGSAAAELARLFESGAGEGKTAATTQTPGSEPDIFTGANTHPKQEQPNMSTQDSGEATKPPKGIHTIKMLQDYFPHYKTKKRTAQIRLNDRNYQEGDLLVVQEYSDLLNVKTGPEFICQITSISQPPGLLPGHVLMHTRHLA